VNVGDFYERERARRDLIAFSERMDPKWQRAPHLQHIARALQALERREIRKLCIVLPPRSGKTQLARKFVAMYLGQHPAHEIIVSSYGAELAEESSRSVRGMLESSAYPFTGVKLREDSRAVGRFATEQGGVLVAVGVQGGLTGRGGDLILCDDLVRDRADAESPAIRASTRVWYDDVLRTRGNANVAHLFIGTLWHEDDIMSSVCFEGPGASAWTRIVLPAYAEEDDPLGRPVGGRFVGQPFCDIEIPSVEAGEISSRSWAALYGCRPVPAIGNLFLRAWCGERHSVTPACSKTVLAVDAASKTSLANDTSGFSVVGRGATTYPVSHVSGDRLDFVDLERRIISLAERFNPTTVLIEEASSGIGVSQQLRRTTRLPIVGVNATKSKVVRAELITGIFEALKVTFPAGEPWVDEFINNELTRFPACKTDDRTDALIHAIQHLSAQTAGAGMWFAKLSNVSPATNRNVYGPDGVYVPPAASPVKATRSVWPRGVNPAKVQRGGGNPLPAKWS
jgi:predicted phage terminase large subunit-like protein